MTERIEHLAHHALCGQVWEKAVIYLRHSGTRAAAHSANQEAIGWLNQALTALEHLPRCRETSETAVDIRLDLRNALWPVGELTRLQNVLREAEALAESIGDQPRLARVLIYLTHCLWGVGDNEGAVAAGQRALEIAKTRGDVGLEALANNYLGYAFHALGEQQRALELVSRNVTGLRGELIRVRFGMYAPPAVFSRTWFALCCAELGQFDEGIAHGQEAIDILETADSPYAMSVACWGRAGVESTRVWGLINNSLIVRRHPD